VSIVTRFKGWITVEMLNSWEKHKIFLFSKQPERPLLAPSLVFNMYLKFYPSAFLMNNMYDFLFSPVCNTYCILCVLYLISQIIIGKKYRS